MHSENINTNKLLEKIEDLEYENNVLRKLEEDKEILMESERRFRSLSGHITELTALVSFDDMYDYICEALDKVLEKTVILFITIDVEKKLAKFDSVKGINSDLLKNIISISGLNPIKRTYPLHLRHLEYYQDNKITLVKEGLINFTAGEWPDFALKAIEKLLNINNIYTIGVKSKERLFAAVHFFTLKDKTFSNSEIDFIETFMRQAGNIFERKLTELELIKSEKKYRILFENMTTGFALHEMIYDKEGKAVDYKYIEVNPAFRRLTGLENCDLIGINVKQVLPGVEDYWIEMAEKVVKSGEPFVYENFASELNRYYESYFFRPKENQFAVIFQDITDRKLTEIALRESEERYRSVVSSMNEGVIIRDSDGVIVACNSSAYRILKIKPKEAIGKKVIREDWKIIDVHGEIFKTENYPAHITLRSGESVHNLIIGIFNNENGKPTWISINSEPVKINYNSAPSGVVSTFMDITHLKEIENELINMNRELEERVLVRTNELEAAYERLEEAFIKEKEFGELQQRFIDLISHEYRTPLTIIGTSVELLKNNIINGNQERIDKHIDKIKVGVSTLSRLIGDVLSFKKSEIENIRVINEPFNLSVIINEVVRESELYNDKELTIIYSSSNHDINLNSDKRLIYRIIFELLINAIKFSPEKSKISISAQLLKDKIEVSVSDEGFGINESDHKKVFEPFYKSSEQIGMKRGIGLGLSLVKKFVAALNGDILLKSQPGKGACFIISLPL